MTSALVEREVPVSESTRAPLRLAFPATLAPRWMPGLFPETRSSNPTAPARYEITRTKYRKLIPYELETVAPQPRLSFGVKNYTTESVSCMARAGSFIASLASDGRHHFTAAEIRASLGVSAAAAKLALNRLSKQGLVASPACGFYAIVPPWAKRWRRCPAQPQ